MFEELKILRTMIFAMIEYMMTAECTATDTQALMYISNPTPFLIF